MQRRNNSLTAWLWIVLCLPLFVTTTSATGLTKNATTTTQSLEENEPPDSAKNITRYNIENQKFHHDSKCNRTAYNDMKCGRGRALRKRVLRHLVAVEEQSGNGDDHFPPSERVVRCPKDQFSLPDWGVPEVGLDTTWIIENTLPHETVLVTYVDYAHDQAEMSPFNTFIPAVDDPRVTIPPNSFLVIQALEGQVFRVRTWDPHGQEPPGPVLLQYRAGVKLIAENYARTGCDPRAPDLKPPRNDTGHNRMPAANRQRCNAIDTGFRNLSPCPLNAYFVFNRTEHFRFHLGTNHSVDAVMKESWTSATKFETTYIPHSYVIRDAATNEFVQRYTSQATTVPDCEYLWTEQDWQNRVILLPTGEMELQQHSRD